jgi:ethanolamine ammonia-lyase large subunit
MKRIVLAAILVGLVVWGLSELFSWLLLDLIGAGSVSRIAPGLAGAVLGAVTAIARRRRKQMLGEGK